MTGVVQLVAHRASGMEVEFYVAYILLTVTTNADALVAAATVQYAMAVYINCVFVTKNVNA